MQYHKHIFSILTFLILSVLVSCNGQQASISYGEDNCHYCKMTIVDQQHAAQSITSKGKVYRYDAIECMLADIKDRKEIDFKTLLVSDFLEKGKFLDAYQSTYLISKAIPSPMGAYLSAFKTRSQANQIKAEKGGALYNFEQLQKVID